jgi:hypothetical protein
LPCVSAFNPTVDCRGLSWPCLFGMAVLAFQSCHLKPRDALRESYRPRHRFAYCAARSNWFLASLSMQATRCDGHRHRAPSPVQRMPQRHDGGLGLSGRQGCRNGAGYDAASGNAFASNADGTLTVIHQDAPDQYHVAETVKTPEGSRNMGLDPANHRVFVASAKFGPAPAGSSRKPVLPDSFTLMVIERDSAMR